MDVLFATKVIARHIDRNLYTWFGLILPSKINKLFPVKERGMASVVRYLSWLSASQVKVSASPVSGLCIRNENNPLSALTGNVTQILLPYEQSTSVHYIDEKRRRKMWEMRGRIIIIMNALAAKNAMKWEHGLTQSHSIGCPWITLITQITVLTHSHSLVELQAHVVTRVFLFKIRCEAFARRRIHTKVKNSSE